MSLNFSTSVAKALRILKQQDNQPADEKTTSTKEEIADLQAAAHSYYQSVMENASIRNKEVTATSAGQNQTCQSGVVPPAEHWFDARSQGKGSRRQSDSQYRLNAFVQNRTNNQLKALDKKQ